MTDKKQQNRIQIGDKGLINNVFIMMNKILFGKNTTAALDPQQSSTALLDPDRDKIPITLYALEQSSTALLDPDRDKIPITLYALEQSSTALLGPEQSSTALLYPEQTSTALLYPEQKSLQYTKNVTSLKTIRIKIKISIEELIQASVYPEELKYILQCAARNKFNSLDDVIMEKKKNGSRLMLFQDEVIIIDWVIDLTDFTHPYGLGPSSSILETQSKYLIYLNEGFLRSNHGNKEMEKLLSRSIGVLVR